mmetsp:Transcript_41575/g.50591  ORF Transcript_41575/g.50591 Transcript_41575/m.50591 type:complete len:217 (-) Transcript_41575:1834-2484(-)
MYKFHISVAYISRATLCEEQELYTSRANVKVFKFDSLFAGDPANRVRSLITDCDNIKVEITMVRFGKLIPLMMYLHNRPGANRFFGMHPNARFEFVLDSIIQTLRQHVKCDGGVFLMTRPQMKIRITILVVFYNEFLCLEPRCHGESKTGHQISFPINNKILTSIHQGWVKKSRRQLQFKVINVHVNTFFGTSEVYSRENIVCCQLQLCEVYLSCH